MSRIRSYHLHLPFYHTGSNSSLKWLYSARVSKDLVNKLSVYFLPIFLYTVGSQTALFQSLPIDNVQRGILSVGIFFVLSKSISFIFAIPLGTTIQRIGYSRAFSYAYLLRIISFTALFFALKFPLLIFLAAVLEGLQSSLFWSSYYSVFSKYIEGIHIRKDLSFSQFCIQIVTVAIPAVAGYLAYHFGLEILFLLGLVVTLVGFMIASRLQFDNENDRIYLKDYKKWLSQRVQKKALIAQSGRVIHDSVLFLWPMYIFITLGSIERVGFVYTLALFLVLITIVFVGMYMDMYKIKKMFLGTGVVLAALWVLRIKLTSFFHIAIVDATDKITGNYHWFYFDKKDFKNGKNNKRLSHFVYCEMTNSLISITFWATFCGVFTFVNNWDALFIVAAIAVVVSTVTGEHIPIFKKE